MLYARFQRRSRGSNGDAPSMADVAVAVVTQRVGTGLRPGGIGTRRSRERERDDEQGEEGTNGARHTTSRYWGDVRLQQHALRSCVRQRLLRVLSRHWRAEL